jgi:hypothetical protein
MRASAVVKRQSISACLTLRSCIQAVTSLVSVSLSGMRRSKHWRVRTLSSVSAECCVATEVVAAWSWPKPRPSSPWQIGDLPTHSEVDRALSADEAYVWAPDLQLDLVPS